MLRRRGVDGKGGLLACRNLGDWIVSDLILMGVLVVVVDFLVGCLGKWKARVTYKDVDEDRSTSCATFHSKQTSLCSFAVLFRGRRLADWRGPRE